jgi:luciferase-like monooxygenase
VNQSLRASRPPAPVTIGIGTGSNQRLVDPGVARALAFAAEELGYSSVWTFDSPAGERWSDPGSGRRPDDVLATLETFVSATSDIRVGVAFVRSPWPLPPPIAGRLIEAQDASGGRIVLARQCSAGDLVPPIGPVFQMWTPDHTSLEAWADGWMFEFNEHERPGPDGRALGRELVVRLPIGADVDRWIADIDDLRTSGASEIVLDVIADDGIDHALALYSRIAEAVERPLDRRTA